MTQATPSTEYPLIGQTIAGKYKIVRLLGEGGMGCVYHGEQQLGTTVRKVAVKTLHTHLSKDEQVKKRFEREVGTVAGLEHPNTIQIFDYGEMPDGTLYIVMEFVAGRSVADILEKDGPMPPERVENILRQVVGSLEEAHDKGIIHRDLKPDNVVLAERAGQKDWVEVLDFGIAKRSTEHDPNEAKLTQQGMVLGTPPYMSPEQFTGQPIDKRSDIYALGVMTYEMLSGKLPWEANTAWEWASKHMTEAPTPIERQPLGANVPQRMRDAVARALAKDKDQRFPDVRSYFDAFSAGAAPATGMSVSPHTPPGGMVGAPPSSPDGRMKTEMGAPAMNPMMMGAPPASNNYGPPGGGYGVNPGPQAGIPAGPQYGASGGGAEPKKSNALIFALGGVAVLLLGGAGLAMALSGHKETPPTPIDLGSATAATPTASAITTSTDPVASVSAAPGLPGEHLGGAVPNSGPHTGPAVKPVPTPHPSAQPAPKPEPQACKDAKEAEQNHRPQAAINLLKRQCTQQGGTL